MQVARSKSPHPPGTTPPDVLLDSQVGLEWLTAPLSQEGFSAPGRPQLDVELLQGLLQLFLVPSKVGGHGIVEEQQLLVHHLDLGVQQGQLRLDSDTLSEGP